MYVPRLCCMRPTKSPLGPNCQLILSAADKVWRTAWCLRSAFRSRAVVVITWWPWRMKADFAHKTWLHSQKVLFVRGGGGGGCPTLTTFFFSWWWNRGSKHHYKRAIIGPPAKHHLNGVSLIDNPTSVIYIRSLPNMECWLGSFVILRGTKLVCLETLFWWFFRGGVRTPTPLWNSPMSCLSFIGLHENSPLSLIAIAI